MRHKSFYAITNLILLVVLLASAGCKPAPAVQTAEPAGTSSPAQPGQASPESPAQPASSEPAPMASATAAPTLPTVQPEIASTPADQAKPQPGPALAPFPTLAAPNMDEVRLVSWSPHPYQGEPVALPVGVDSLGNTPVLDGLTAAQRGFLANNGFVVMHSQEAQFKDIRFQVANVEGQPYYLTTDAALHVFHLQFDGLLKQIETHTLRPQMIALTQTLIEQMRQYRQASQGGPLEEDARTAQAYLWVARKLFDPQAEVDSDLADIVQAQLNQIMAGEGRGKSVLFPNFEDDYGAYKPVGHYTETPLLEQYFRGMTWFGRVHFKLSDPQDVSFQPSRVPLLITLALRQAQLEGAPAAHTWMDLHGMLSYLIGPTDDAGPVEYAALMDQVYGDSLALESLANEARWAEFLAQRDQLPAPRINSTFVNFLADLPQETGWRFMGQRFTLDGFFLQNLIFDKVAANNGEKRLFGSGLDVMAVLGSQPAYQTLLDQGNASYPNYETQMSGLQQIVQAQPMEEWLSTLYNAWLYTFLPVLADKAEAFPSLMQTPAWSYKELNTALGSWAELKHDTVLYAKMPEGAGGGGPPMSDAAPAYVEPNPDVFYRLAYMAEKLSHIPAYSDDFPLDAPDYADGMMWLAEDFKRFGDIAAKELAGEALTVSDFEAIRKSTGTDEFLSRPIRPNGPPENEMPHPAVIAAVQGAENQVLEVGVGKVDRIYVVVPLEGRLQVAQGGVFSYYEFLQPRDQRLTDEEWRSLLSSANAPSLPEWAGNFVLSGGKPAPWLAFRVNDIYRITEAGDQLNARSEPGTNNEILGKLVTHDYIQIIDGPVMQGGFTWWKIQRLLGADGQLTGWAVENQEWYERSDHQ